MDPVVHFEMPAEDRARVKKFYETVFGWKMIQMGPEMGDYILAGTSPLDENNMHLNKGAINGGFYTKGKDGTTTHVVISVADLKKSMEKVTQAGGKIEGEPVDIPGVGTYIMIHDSEDNRVGMLQPPARM